MTKGAVAVAGQLLAGGTRDVVVALEQPMPDATYVAAPVLMASSSLLGKVVIDGVSAQTRTAVTVRVRNAGLAALMADGTRVGVVATHMPTT
ncbi:hypothetical protein WDZ16_12895 [Pseudokineococcus marinus]|uniref:Uncharacterized protein n=1 Tax=Pseudokineococcus marinus TaxID=351215 RepID=A0A849BLF5_9ACTN|nr:hypothetical protein [Pseudokineococcus marinus]NNH21632.1 hypothetical protein [Pseudokineococcus marinus]